MLLLICLVVLPCQHLFHATAARVIPAPKLVAMEATNAQALHYSHSPSLIINSLEVGNYARDNYPIESEGLSQNGNEKSNEENAESERNTQSQSMSIDLGTREIEIEIENSESLNVRQWVLPEFLYVLQGVNGFGETQLIHQLLVELGKGEVNTAPEIFATWRHQDFEKQIAAAAANPDKIKQLQALQKSPTHLELWKLPLILDPQWNLKDHLVQWFQSPGLSQVLYERRETLKHEGPPTIYQTLQEMEHLFIRPVLLEHFPHSNVMPYPNGKTKSYAQPRCYNLPPEQQQTNSIITPHEECVKIPAWVGGTPSLHMDLNNINAALELEPHCHLYNVWMALQDITASPLGFIQPPLTHDRVLSVLEHKVAQPKKPQQGGDWKAYTDQKRLFDNWNEARQLITSPPEDIRKGAIIGFHHMVAGDFVVFNSGLVYHSSLPIVDSGGNNIRRSAEFRYIVCPE